MCGNALASQPAAEPEYVVQKVPISLEREAPEVRRPTAVPVEPEPVERRAEVPPLEPVAPAPRSDKWWVDESSTTVGGPSFLGLSSGESNEGGGGYSYLFQEEPERSHKGLWIFLIVLLALGGVLYAKWQPIRDYVLTTAISHSRPQQPPAQETKNEPSPVPASSAPTTTLATSDAPSQPAITTENPPQSKTADQGKAADQKADQKEALPGGNKESAAGKSDAKSDTSGASTGRGENATSKQQAAKLQAGDTKSAAADEASSNEADDESASAADEEKPSSAKNARATPSNPGGELVTSGEKYLYGRGVARSCDQAVSYFNAAAAKQNPQAFSHLGALYATGECVPMDRAVAYAWFRRAYSKEPNNHYFEQNLTMLWREMTPEERQRATGSRTASNF